MQHTAHGVANGAEVVVTAAEAAIPDAREVTRAATVADHTNMPGPFGTQPRSRTDWTLQSAPVRGIPAQATHRDFGPWRRWWSLPLHEDFDASTAALEAPRLPIGTLGSTTLALAAVTVAPLCSVPRHRRAEVAIEDVCSSR